MTYVCSDIHGCYDKYTALLDKIKFNDGDTLYVLGDVIDRGDGGVKILQDMMERANVIPILGNHEIYIATCLAWLGEEITDESLANLSDMQTQALSEWIANGGMPTISGFTKLSTNEREDIIEYVNEMSLYEEVTANGNEFLLTHSGLDNFSPNKPMWEYELFDFLFCRPSLNDKFYPNKRIVFGHTPTRELRRAAGKKLSDDIIITDDFIATDCACSYIGKLGAVCLDNLETFYVGA